SPDRGGPPARSALMTGEGAGSRARRLRRCAQARAAEAAAEGTRPSQDLSASPEYREHLARVLTKRAVLTATGMG
ncbi:hypothetical protein ABZ471_36280, partial [Streptomyces sp. NPDC005728]